MKREKSRRTRFARPGVEQRQLWKLERLEDLLFDKEQFTANLTQRVIELQDKLLAVYRSEELALNTLAAWKPEEALAISVVRLESVVSQLGAVIRNQSTAGKLSPPAGSCSATPQQDALAAVQIAIERERDPQKLKLLLKRKQELCDKGDQRDKGSAK